MRHLIVGPTIFCVLVMFSACSVTRSVPTAVEPATLRAYLAEHPAANLRVTEPSGRRYWVHAPEMRGDSLVGRRRRGVVAGHWVYASGLLTCCTQMK